ncbi:NnrU family protein [Altererythrobacter sp. H2]|uniref:NnrU family protein n=1 Tax=Altererythrobacter sp. H2 TaxID=3108391 RepID=UPI002B4BAF24|nr:NnrU family protein [Altererythrobacter sp. H2]WRK95903.1 NnrU family protein [Altererythrobacter sp. H2]
MDGNLLALVAASVAFVGTHFAMSHPLRAGLVRMLGEKGFQGVYSLVSIGTFAWMYLAFKDAPATTPLWPGFGDVSWAIGTLVALVAMVLFAGSLLGRNPALPMPGAEAAARAEPAGVFRITRHPMMWGFALWAVSHIVAAPTARTLVVATAILVLALVGSHLQDRKKQVLMGAAWKEWESRTRYWPRWSALASAGFLPWAVGLVLWLALSWAHLPAGGIPAGLWRWIG